MLCEQCAGSTKTVWCLVVILCIGLHYVLPRLRMCMVRDRGGTFVRLSILRPVSKTCFLFAPCCWGCPSRQRGRDLTPALSPASGCVYHVTGGATDAESFFFPLFFIFPPLSLVRPQPFRPVGADVVVKFFPPLASSAKYVRACSGWEVVQHRLA